MKMPKRLIASLGVLMISATPLLASADQRNDQRDDHDHGGPQQGQHDNRGDDHRGLAKQPSRRPAAARLRPGAPDHSRTIMATSSAARRHRRVFVWNVGGRCHTGITGSVWITAR
jgi:hypothetical protein